MPRVLKAELVGWYRGKKIERPYRAVLVFPDESFHPREPLIKIEEQLSDGYWCSTPGQWYVSTLTDALMGPTRSVGMMSIDFDREWSVSGVDVALQEALVILSKGGGMGDGEKKDVAEAALRHGSNS